MAHVLRMPEIAANVTHAVLETWVVDEGATVRVGDVIAEIETEKALVEFTAEYDGILHEKLVKPGTEVRVGAPIAILAEKGEIVVDSSELHEPNREIGQSAEGAEAVAPQMASPIGADHPSEAIPENEVGPRQFISPIVRKMARETDISLESLKGTGPRGRVTKRDFQNYIDSHVNDESKPREKLASLSGSPSGSEKSTSAFASIPHTPMRRAIARRLSESKANVPHFYLTSQCQVDALLDLRRSVNEASARRISITDFVIKAAAAAFIAVPEANAVWTDEAMLRYDNIDISIAVATEKGLVSPVLRNLESLTLSGISQELSSIVERAHSGRLRQQELEGGSFAITNLGMFGTTSFAAILNPPQSGILAVGSVHLAPVVAGGELAMANVMNCTMSVDHRAIDGALAAQWLAQFTRFMENPAAILI